MRGNELVEGVLKEWESIVNYNWHDFSIYIYIYICLSRCISRFTQATLYRQSLISRTPCLAHAQIYYSWQACAWAQLFSCSLR